MMNCNEWSNYAYVNSAFAVLEHNIEGVNKCIMANNTCMVHDQLVKEGNTEKIQAHTSAYEDACKVLENAVEDNTKELCKGLNKALCKANYELYSLSANPFVDIITAHCELIPQFTVKFNDVGLLEIVEGKPKTIDLEAFEKACIASGNHSFTVTFPSKVEELRKVIAGMIYGEVIADEKTNFNFEFSNISNGNCKSDCGEKSEQKRYGKVFALAKLQEVVTAITITGYKAIKFDVGYLMAKCANNGGKMNINISGKKAFMVLIVDVLCRAIRKDAYTMTVGK